MQRARPGHIGRKEKTTGPDANIQNLWWERPGKIRPEQLFNIVGENPDRGTRFTADPQNITVKRTRLDIRKNTYALRVAGDWNKLSSKTKTSRTVTSLFLFYFMLLPPCGLRSPRRHFEAASAGPRCLIYFISLSSEFLLLFYLSTLLWIQIQSGSWNFPNLDPVPGPSVFTHFHY